MSGAGVQSAGQVDLVAFGEIMLRLSPPGHQLFLQSPGFDAWLAGAEANVATALARLGKKVRMASAVPSGALGDAAVAILRGHGVDVSGIQRLPGRMGLCWVQSGAGPRPAEVIYDRAGSAFVSSHLADWDWDVLLGGAGRLHLSGITPALGPHGTAMALAACEAAQRMGIPISLDGNYRATLWQAWESDPQRIMRDLVSKADILFGNHRDIGLLLGNTFSGSGSTRRREAVEAAFEAFPNLELVASTARHVEDSDRHRLSARVDSKNEYAETDEVIVSGIVDRIGTGDAFAAGALYSLMRGDALATIALSGLALCVYKHTIPGDATLVSNAFFEQIQNTGDVRR
jgi:2-dehydro-3-deoxygluconokinase